MLNPHDENKKNIPHALDILYEMRRAGLENDFINHLMEHCQRYEGLQDLVQMWFEESDA